MKLYLVTTRVNHAKKQMWGLAHAGWYHKYILSNSMDEASNKSAEMLSYALQDYDLTVANVSVETVEGTFHFADDVVMTELVDELLEALLEGPLLQEVVALVEPNQEGLVLEL